MSLKSYEINRHTWSDKKIKQISKSLDETFSRLKVKLILAVCILALKNEEWYVIITGMLTPDERAHWGEGGISHLLVVKNSANRMTSSSHK